MRTRSECGSVRLVSAGAFFALVLTGPAAAQVTSRVSVSSSGTQGDSDSNAPSISADGRYVAFQSYAGTLVIGDANFEMDVFVHDREGDTTELVSIDSLGAQADFGSYYPAISGDGRYVAFASYATNLVAGDTNTINDIFVHDRQSGTTERVSVTSGGAEGDGESGDFGLSISADGRYVAFASRATNLVGGDTNGVGDVFVHDRQGGTTERVSVDAGGAEGNGQSELPLISADGRYVAFNSYASNLVGSDTNGVRDTFVRDRQGGTTERVSVGSGGAEGNDECGNFGLSISGDGRYVAFDSYATNLVGGDTNGFLDAFVHDRQSGTTERVSVASGGAQGNSDSGEASISADGGSVAFMSHATNLVGGDTNSFADVFVHGRSSGITERASVSSGGAQGNGGTGFYNPWLSSDGRYVTFDSEASNLVSGDTNDAYDVFVRDRGAGIGTKYCTANVNSTGSPADLSASGSTSSGASGLILTSMPVPNQSGIFFHGANPSQVPFGNGFLCASGGIVRGAVVTGVGNVATYTYDNTDAKHGLVAFIGSTRNFQHWFRDPAGGGAFFNTSNAISILILP